MDRVFLIDPATSRSFSYGQFLQSAAALAEHLRVQGLISGDRLAILLKNSPEFAATYFACLYLGIAAVPINPALHHSEIEFILKNSGAKFLLLSPETEPLLARSSIPKLRLSRLEELPSGARSWESLEGFSEKDIFSIVFTSGTTGQPKAVCHKIKGLIRNAALFNEIHGIGPQNRFYHILPMSYTAGFFNLLLSPFLAGSSVVLSDGISSKLALEFWHIPVRYEVNTLWLVPTVVSMLLKVDRDEEGLEYCQKKITHAFIGTAPLPLQTRRKFQSRYGTTLLESYGLSETLFVTTNSRGRKIREDSVGHPLDGIEIKIKDESGCDLHTGQEGEIFIKTPDLMAGYLDYQSLKTAPAPTQEFSSGDIGLLGNSGELYITGRKKDLIIRGGIKVSSQAIENVLAKLSVVEEVIVVGIPHEIQGEEIVVAIQFKLGYNLRSQQDQLVSYCQENFSALSQPTRFVEIDKLPLGLTGKIQKKKIREMLIKNALGVST